MIRWIKRTAVLGAAVLLQLYGAAAYYAWQLPDNYYVQTGSQLEVDTALHISAVPTAHTVQAAAASARTAETTSLRLFGVIPVKEVEVQEIDTPMLVPCGEPFGIKLRMDGAMVVGMERVDTPEGRRCPAQEAGIQTGDLIRSVNGQVIDSNQSLQDAIADSDGVPVTVTLERGEETCTVTLTPAYAAADNRYEAGIWVRDSSAGIGTITFYEPGNRRFRRSGASHLRCRHRRHPALWFGRGSCCDHLPGGERRLRQSGNAPGQLFGRDIPGRADLQQPLRRVRDAVPQSIR